jgi:hypothetical protein
MKLFRAFVALAVALFSANADLLRYEANPIPANPISSIAHILRVLGRQR